MLTFAGLLLVGMTTLAPAAAADDLVEETIETPVTTFYIFARHGAFNEPDPSLTDVCLQPGNTPQVCLPVPTSGTTIPPFEYIHIQVYRETNGCDDLQRQPEDCDDDGETEPADRTTFKYDSR